MNEKERQRRHAQFLAKKRGQATKRITRVLDYKAKDDTRLNEPCKCGSSKPFKSCCYRPDHTRFDLRRVMSTYKDTLNKLRSTTQIRLINEYNRGNQIIREAADGLARKMGTTTLYDFQQGHQHALDYFRGAPDIPAGEILARTIMFQELALDKTLPGYDKPLFQVFTRAQLRKATDPNAEKRALQALSGGILSIFEVINARQGADPRYTGWLLLKDMFSGNVYEFKDPNFNCRFEQWSLVLGRMIEINGFHTFDTISIGVPALRRPFINRILLFLHFKHMLEHDGATIDVLEARYPALFAAFPVLNDPLERAGLFSPDLAAFIRANPTVIHTIYHLLTEETDATADPHGEGKPNDVSANDILQYRLHFGTLHVPSLKAFHDNLLMMNDRLTSRVLDEQKQFMEVAFVGTLPPRGDAANEDIVAGADEAGIEKEHAYELDMSLPPLTSLLDLSLDAFVERIEGAYKKAMQAIYMEYKNAGDPEPDQRTRESKDTIILDNKNCITICARDDAHLEFLKAACDTTATRLGGPGIRWQKTITMKDFMDIVNKALAKTSLLARASANDGIVGDEFDGNWDDDGYIYDDFFNGNDGNDDDDYDSFLDDDDMPAYPVEFITKRMSMWTDKPKAVLLGKTPRECVANPRFEAALVMLVKQVEHYDKLVFRDRERPTYWKLLGLKRRL
ncbi:MAG: SEC-C domain-containing protein [Candidatus Sigynarchaeota archaeon]